MFRSKYALHYSGAGVLNNRRFNSYRSKVFYFSESSLINVCIGVVSFYKNKGGYNFYNIINFFQAWVTPHTKLAHKNTP